MNKKELISKIENGSYNKVQLLGWVNTLPSEVRVNRPSRIKIGDVFMHPIFGHPVVLCKRVQDTWYGIMLTSTPSCDVMLEPCQSRFFNNSYFTSTMTGFKEMPRMFMGVYDNNTHLNEVYKKVNKLYDRRRME